MICEMRAPVTPPSHPRSAWSRTSPRWTKPSKWIATASNREIRGTCPGLPGPALLPSP